MKAHKINIYSIAKEAHVSPATVSRVLNNSTPVSEEKEKRVKEIIKKYDFKPNILARRLSNNKTKVIGIMAADIRNPFYADLFVECEMAAKTRGYTVMLCNSLGKNELEDFHLEELYEQRVDAIIQIGGRVDEFISDEKYVSHVNKILNYIPIVITGKLDRCDCIRININERLAIEKVVEYLVNLGHKDIALIGGRNNVKSTYDKRKRYKELLGKYNLKYRDEYVVECRDYNMYSGFEGMNKLFESHVKLPTAVIGINDFTSIGIIKSIMKHGLCIPKDISIASFDNTFVCEASVPRLTSVSYDYKEFGECLISTAIDCINNKKVCNKLVNCNLVIRDSCRKL